MRAWKYADGMSSHLLSNIKQREGKETVRSMRNQLGAVAVSMKPWQIRPEAHDLRTKTCFSSPLFIFPLTGVCGMSGLILLHLCRQELRRIEISKEQKYLTYKNGTSYNHTPESVVIWFVDNFLQNLPLKNCLSYPNVISVWKCSTKTQNISSYWPVSLGVHSCLKVKIRALSSNSHRSVLSFSSILPFPFSNFPKLHRLPLQTYKDQVFIGWGLLACGLSKVWEGQGERTYRFIRGRVRGMGCLFNRYLFQLYLVDIKLELGCTVELFGKRSRRCLARCMQSICSVEEIQFSAQAWTRMRGQV